MSALKDLRELVNVSRLTFREDSDEDDKSPVSARMDLPKSSELDSRKNPLISHAEPLNKKSFMAGKNSSKPFVSASMLLTDRSALLDRSITDFQMPVKGEDWASFKNLEDQKVIEKSLNMSKKRSDCQ